MPEQWFKVAILDELPSEGLGHRVIANGLDVALFRWNGRIFALEDLCPHLGFPLSEGVVQSGDVICSWHGWRVRLDNGSCWREKDRARRFECDVRGDEVWVKVD